VLEKYLLVNKHTPSQLTSLEWGSCYVARTLHDAI